MAYLYRTYTATVYGSVTRVERCVGCSNVFRYEVSRSARGGGHSAFLLNNAGAAATADRRARENLQRALNEAIEPRHCPVCGLYQPEMASELRKRLGQEYDPNKYAHERVATRVADAWDKTQAVDTLQSYQHFVEAWPTQSHLVEQRVRELKHPILVKLTVYLYWIYYGCWALVVFLVVIGVYFGWL